MYLSVESFSCTQKQPGLTIACLNRASRASQGLFVAIDASTETFCAGWLTYADHEPSVTPRLIQLIAELFPSFHFMELKVLAVLELLEYR